MLRSTGLAQVPEEAPLVELLRSLADELDEGGGSRPRIEYRNALKDVRAVLNATGRPKGTAEPVTKPPAKKPDAAEVVDVASDEPAATPNSLADFKARKGISA
jgi:hypothetical protein